MRPFYPNVKRIPRLYYWIAWALCNLTESSKSPASIAQSNKQWVGTCLYQEWCKPLLISCEAAFGYEQVAKRIANIRLTALQEDILALPAVRIWVYRDTEHRFYDLG